MDLDRAARMLHPGLRASRPGYLNSDRSGRKPLHRGSDLGKRLSVPVVVENAVVCGSFSWEVGGSAGLLGKGFEDALA